MRGPISDLSNLSFNVLECLREFANRHFHNGLGGAEPGIYVRIPFTRFSGWFEWRSVNAGVGQERTGAMDWTFYLGRLQGVLSVEPKAAA